MVPRSTPIKPIHGLTDWPAVRRAHGQAISASHTAQVTDRRFDSNRIPRCHGCHLRNWQEPRCRRDYRPCAREPSTVLLRTDLGVGAEAASAVDQRRAFFIVQVVDAAYHDDVITAGY